MVERPRTDERPEFSDAARFVHEHVPMRSVCKFAVLAAVGLFLAVSCGSKEPLTGAAGTGGMSGGTGGVCEHPIYGSPGCGGNVTPRCGSSTGGAIYCAGFACGCDGKITQGCAPNFDVPYAYSVPGGVDAGHHFGDSCDPDAAAGP